jgi:hypothetical protein
MVVAPVVGSDAGVPPLDEYFCTLVVEVAPTYTELLGPMKIFHELETTPVAHEAVTAPEDVILEIVWLPAFTVKMFPELSMAMPRGLEPAPVAANSSAVAALAAVLATSMIEIARRPAMSFLDFTR